LIVWQIILADILIIARIFPRPTGSENTMQLVKYPRVLSVKPSNKLYICIPRYKDFGKNFLGVDKNDILRVYRSRFYAEKNWTFLGLRFWAVGPFWGLVFA